MCGCEKHWKDEAECTCICDEHANFEMARDLAFARMDSIRELRKAYELIYEQFLAMQKNRNELRERVSEYANDLERFGPVFGPVDGTGRPDPKGEMMVDMSMDGLVMDIRALLEPPKTTPGRRPRREN